MTQDAMLRDEQAICAAEPATAGASMTPWRLLHVEADVVEAMKLKLALHDRLPIDSQIQHVATIQVALQSLAEQPFDAVLVGYSFNDATSDEPLRTLIQNPNGTPVVVLSLETHSDAMLRAGRLGVRDFLSKEKLTGEGLATLLRPIIIAEGGDAESALNESRKAGRYDVFAPAVVLPVLADGRPGAETPASVVNMSRLGVGVLVERDPQSIPDLCVVGVEGQDGAYRYATVAWRHRRLALPAVHLGGIFVAGGDDPLDARHLAPRLDAHGLRYAAPMDPQLLRAWATRGVLRSRVVDRVKSCAVCYSLLTFRDGCPKCGSFDTERTPLVHHFACAHVGPLTEFGVGELVCPKCQSDKLVVGADFEYLDGPRQCRECSWSDAELTLIAECMSCGQRADARDAVERDVIAYHVNRLDPLDFLQNDR
ncbi:hypothetical protein OAS39_01910 [Pirellulales bacterium]|nr:hypothetical protein [Pirellulales bacterium]